MDDFTLAKIVRSDMLNKSFEAEIDTFHLFTSLVCIVKGVCSTGAQEVFRRACANEVCSA